MNRREFFAAIRHPLFSGRLNQAQVDGMEAILDEARSLPLAYVAYCLATAHGETGGRFVPIQENMNYSARRIPQVFSARRLKGHTPEELAGNPRLLANTVYGGMLGNDAPGDGWTYRGHGLVQVTGKDNFRRFGDLIGVDLVRYPERALELPIAAKALIVGVVDGLYTGKKASDYLDSSPPDYVNARRIINGTFAAAKYAMYAREYDAALKRAGW
jgi:putative chitinase